jgi:HEAT repeat protein
MSETEPIDRTARTARIARIVAQLRSPDLSVRIEALRILKQRPQPSLGDSAVEALIENLSSPSKTVQRYAADALAAAGAVNLAVAARLIDLLDGPQPRARWVAAYALSLIDGALDLRACAPLLEAFANPDGDVRWAALELIVKLGRRYPGPIRDRLLAIQNCTDPNSRKMSLYALRDLGLRDPVVMAAVCAACAHADSQVRLAALSFIRAAGGGAAVDAVLTCLESDPEAGVRRAAAFALGYLGDHSQRVLGALHRANAADDAALRKAASQTLARLKEEP